MKSNNLPLLLVLLVALGGVWFYQRQQAEKAFKTGSLEELKTATAIFRRAQQETALAKIYDKLATDSIQFIGSLEGTKLYKDNIASEREHKIAECEAEADLRRAMSALENKLKEKSGGLLPPWITQEREWQIIDEHIRKSKVTTPRSGCREAYKN